VGHDVVIVGAGPAGIATALFFAHAAPHRRHRVVVLEKERFPREKICAGAVGGRADRLLASIGVGVDVPSAHVRGLAVRTTEGTLEETHDRVIGRVVRRVEHDHALVNAARARGIEVREGARVTGVTFDRSGVRIETSEGSLRARAVVGADGVGSFVRRVLGAPRGRWLAQVVEADTPAGPNERDDRALLRFDLTDRSLSGYAWDFPTIVGGVPLVCRGLYELRLDRDGDRDSDGDGDGDRDTQDVGARLVARMAAMGVPSGAKLKRFAERGLALHEPMARPRALLVGEAAGIDPALGEGIAQAILYGEVAGRYLAARIDRDDLGFEDWPRVLGGSRVGVDLRLRARATPWLYGPSRPLAERWVASSHALARAGVRYFAGERVPRRSLARAAIELAALSLPR
jgi:flavin-dependent dehydrogenase